MAKAVREAWRWAMKRKRRPLRLWLTGMVTRVQYEPRGASKKSLLLRLLAGCKRFEVTVKKTVETYALPTPVPVAKYGEGVPAQRQFAVKILVQLKSRTDCQAADASGGTGCEPKLPSTSLDCTSMRNTEVGCVLVQSPLLISNWIMPSVGRLTMFVSNSCGASAESKRTAKRSQNWPTTALVAMGKMLESRTVLD